MAPEEIRYRKKQIDRYNIKKADIFSFGLTLLYVLSMGEIE